MVWDELEQDLKIRARGRRKERIVVAVLLIPVAATLVWLVYRWAKPYFVDAA